MKDKNDEGFFTETISKLNEESNKITLLGSILLSCYFVAIFITITGLAFFCFFPDFFSAYLAIPFFVSAIFVYATNTLVKLLE